MTRMPSTELRAWMKANRYSIHALAEAIDYHPSTVQRWRTGELPVPVVVALALKTLERGEQ